MKSKTILAANSSLCIRVGLLAGLGLGAGGSLVSAFVPSSVAPPASSSAVPAVPVPSTRTTSRSAFTRIDTSTNISTTRRKAFQTMIPSQIPTAAPTSLNMMPLEDIIYNAQSTASNMASSSLSTFTASTDPTATGVATSITSLAILYFAGLLTSFSPCALSLLPLTMSYISSAAGDRKDRNVVFPTLAFACGLAAVFCGLGLSVSFLGGVFGGSSSGSGAGENVLGAFLLAGLSSGVSIAMGLQLLEIVNIPLPSLELNLNDNGGGSVATAAATANGNENGNGECVACSQIAFDQEGNILQSSNEATASSSSSTSTSSSTTTDTNTDATSDINSLFRTFLLGGSSALVASPCATPVLTSILAFVAATKDPTLGAILLLTYTVGYSTPLLVVAASGGQALVNLQSSGGEDGEEGGIVGKIGQLVNPLTASVLIWYGVNGFLDALFGDPSLAGLAPIFD